MKKNKGFTLIEVVVVVAVLSLLLAGMFTIFDIGIKMYAKDNTQVANQESVRTVMSSIEKKIRRADNRTSPFKEYNGCLMISRKSENPDLYCFVEGENTVTLNNSPILDRIADFNWEIQPSTDENEVSSITITITSIVDSMNQENTLSETFIARKGW